jgi:hypothetical protein
MSLISLDLTIALTVQTDHSGDGFFANFIGGDPPAGLAAGWHGG